MRVVCPVVDPRFLRTCLHVCPCFRLRSYRQTPGEDLMLAYLRVLFFRFLSESSSCGQFWATSSVTGCEGATPSGSWSQTVSWFGSPFSPVTVMLSSGTP